jgi:hypothetical protein
MEGSGSGIAEVLLSFCHKESRKFKENLIQDSRYSSQDSNQIPPKYRSAVFLLYQCTQFCGGLYCQATRCHMSAKSDLHSNCYENLKAYDTNDLTMFIWS